MPNAVKLRDVIEYLQTLDQDLRCHVGKSPSDLAPLEDARQLISIHTPPFANHGTILQFHLTPFAATKAAVIIRMEAVLKAVAASLNNMEENLSIAQGEILGKLKGELITLKGGN